MWCDSFLFAFLLDLEYNFNTLLTTSVDNLTHFLLNSKYLSESLDSNFHFYLMTDIP